MLRPEGMQPQDTRLTSSSRLPHLPDRKRTCEPARIEPWCPRFVGDAHGCAPIRIGAQAHLQKFYGDLGFVAASEVYDEDGIPHIEMTQTP